MADKATDAPADVGLAPHGIRYRWQGGGRHRPPHVRYFVTEQLRDAWRARMGNQVQVIAVGEGRDYLAWDATD